MSQDPQDFGCIAKRRGSGDFTGKRSASTILLMLVATIALLLQSQSVSAVTLSQIQSQINSQVNNSNSNIAWSILIENEWGTQTYYSLNADTPRRPASNTKIFTTAAAFGIRGTSYVWNGYQLGSSSTSSPVHSILTFSNNSLADSLYSNVGGGSAILNWCSSIGIDMTGAQMFDGSGLSYSNRFTSRQTLILTRYMMDNYTYGQWGSHLAIGCFSGTLGSRFCGTVGSGRVHAKTGTLTNGQTLSLSGYIDNPNDGERYFFSIYCNSVPSSSQSQTRQIMDNIVNVMGQSNIPNPGQDLGGIIVDNSDSGYSETGSWANSASSGFYGTESRWASAVNGANTATWSPNLGVTGNYDVYVWYVSGSNRSPAASYTVNHANGSTLLYGNDNGDGIINGINQQANGSNWVKLGNWTFNSGSGGSVTLDSVDSFNGGDPGAVVSADAVQFVLTESLATEVIVDNTDSGFTAPSSNWFPSSSVSGYLGSNYHARATASTSDAATWNVTLPESGNYEVFARWTTGGNRATSAPYIVIHNGGSTTINANQQQNNGVWMSLGTYSFNSGSADRVLLSCWTSSGDYVIADAVRFVKVN